MQMERFHCYVCSAQGPLHQTTKILKSVRVKPVRLRILHVIHKFVRGTRSAEPIQLNPCVDFRVRVLHMIQDAVCNASRLTLRNHGSADFALLTV